MRSGDFWIWFDDYCAPRLKRGQARDTTFRKMFEHLDWFDRPVVIVETGTIEDADNWEGNGCSTIMFNRYIETHPGSMLFSIDLDPAHVVLARDLCNAVGTAIIGADSVEYLKTWGNNPIRRRDEKIDLLYLDASHLDWNNETPAANHHLNELYAIMPALRPDTLVVVDDSPAMIDDYPHITVGGKGALVAKHAFAIGADLAFHEYQIGWTKITNRPVPSTTDLRELVSRAREHFDAGRLVQADEIYRVILVMCGRQPEGQLERKSRAEACAFYGMNAMDKDDAKGAAIDWFRKAVVADPIWTDHRIWLVKASYRLGLMEAARAEAERATRIARDDYRTWKALGDMELQLEHADAAIEAYEHEMAIAPPGYLDAFLDRAAVAVDVEDYARARMLADKLMGTKIEADAWHVRGMIHYRHGEHEQAIECYQKAIAGKARDQAQVHWNYSLPLHSIGRYREGWEQHEWRRYATHELALSMPMRRFNLPKWNGQRPPALIHVHGEAGAGDNISCARYFQLMLEDGYQVRFESLGTMEKLFKDSFPDVEVVERAPDYPGVTGIQPFDYHCPMGSLPAIYKTDLDTVPWYGPYIKADPELVADYNKRPFLTGTFDRGLKVGLCWSSGIRLKEGVWMERYGRHKSMHFDQIVPLVEQSNDMLFYNLQIGPERAQQYGLLEVLPEKPSWAETAAFIECLDLVISVDTSIAHLAGAMGKPVLLAMHSQGSWHFMVGRPGKPFTRRSPWYPNTLIYRQLVPDQWSDVVLRIGDDLKSGAWQKELGSWPWERKAAAAE